MNPNGGLQPAASMALAYSDTLLFQQLLSPPHDQFHFSNLSLISVSFFHALFYFSFFPAFSRWPSFISVRYMVILIPPALAVFGILGRRTLCFRGEESAGTCCPSYFMPHCDRDPVFSHEYSTMNNATQSQLRP